MGGCASGRICRPSLRTIIAWMARPRRRRVASWTAPMMSLRSPSGDRSSEPPSDGSDSARRSRAKDNAITGAPPASWEINPGALAESARSIKPRRVDRPTRMHAVRTFLSFSNNRSSAWDWKAESAAAAAARFERSVLAVASFVAAGAVFTAAISCGSLPTSAGGPCGEARRAMAAARRSSASRNRACAAPAPRPEMRAYSVSSRQRST